MKTVTVIDPKESVLAEKTLLICQEEFYLKWCRDEIGRRVDAIVSNQHRGSYHKAAGLLVAMAETLANREERQDGMDFIDRYKNKYPRHTAFKSDVTQAVQTSGLFDVRAV